VKFIKDGLSGSIQKLLATIIALDPLGEPAARVGTTHGGDAEDKLLPRTPLGHADLKEFPDRLDRTPGQHLRLREENAQMVSRTPRLDLRPASELDESRDVDRFLAKGIGQSIDEEFPIFRGEAEHRRTEKLLPLQDGREDFRGSVFRLCHSLDSVPQTDYTSQG